jgi:hypothetical protein
LVLSWIAGAGGRANPDPVSGSVVKSYLAVATILQIESRTSPQALRAQSRGLKYPTGNEVLFEPTIHALLKRMLMLPRP